MVQREALVHEKIDRLFTRLRDLEVVDFDAAFAALTADIITHIFYGQDFDYLGSRDFASNVRDAILGLIGY